jgi:hypothetical protein
LTKKELTFADILDFQTKVIEWNQIFGINPDSKEYTGLYQQLTFEECFKENELVESIEKGDMVGVADALADNLFTCLQWAVLDGKPLTLDDKQWFDRVVKGNNMKTIALEQYKDAVIEGDSYKAQTALLHLLESYSDVIDIVGAFNLVYESNLSKAVHESKDIDISAEIAYIESQGRYGDITCERSGEYFVFKAGQDVRDDVVFDKAKIIKSSLFLSVEDLGGLSSFVY